MCGSDHSRHKHGRLRYLCWDIDNTPTPTDSAHLTSNLITCLFMLRCVGHARTTVSPLEARGDLNHHLIQFVSCNHGYHLRRSFYRTSLSLDKWIFRYRTDQ